LQNKTIAKLYAIASNNSTKSRYPFVYQAIFNKIQISKKRYPNSNFLLFRGVSIFTANLNRSGTLPTFLLHTGLFPTSRQKGRLKTVFFPFFTNS